MRSGSPKAGGALVNSVEKGGPADKAGIEVRRHHPQGRRQDREHVVRTAAHRQRQVKPGTKVTLQVWRKGATQGHRRHRRRTQGGRRRQADEAKRAAEQGQGQDRIAWAWSCRISPTSRRRNSRSRTAWWSRTVRGAARGDIQPGDVILRVISTGATTEAKSAEQVNALIAKLDKSASVTLLVRRGDAAVLHRRSSWRANVRMSRGAKLTLLGRAYCHLCDEMLRRTRSLCSVDHDSTVEVVDVDADPALGGALGRQGAGAARQRERELCHYHLDLTRLTRGCSR